ncbi:G-protein beta WD- 40 repeats containing protein [Penicillium malachiteum]|nr:G-protein beta WD- 40 repeats containing protein [Penicillium malachiteum]
MGATHTGSTVKDVAFSPDGKLIASSTSDTVYIWDATTGGFLKEMFEGVGSSITSVAFSPDGKQIVCGSSNSIRIWDMTKVVIRPIQYVLMIWSLFRLRFSREIKTSENIRRLKFSSDSRYLTTNIGPINIASGNRASRVPMHGQITSVPLHDLYVRDQWICYGEVSLLRMPSDFMPMLYDAQGDQLIIVFMGGRVSSFCIDRKALLSMFGDCSKFC